MRQNVQVSKHSFVNPSPIRLVSDDVDDGLETSRALESLCVLRFPVALALATERLRATVL
jgi:hypothetical protein